MATKINQVPGLSNLSESLLLNTLRKNISRREGDGNFIGLKRSNALSDVDSPAKSLNNILEKLSDSDSAENNQYGGPYNGVDWFVTRDFIDEQIDREFLLPLSGASIGGGSLGSTVPVNPRIRIEDRISNINSFYGLGSFSGYHSGPDARFYRNVNPKVIGYVKFTFSGSNVTVLSNNLKKPDKVTDLTVSEILDSQEEVVLDLSKYEISNSLNVVDLSGSNISLRLVSQNSTWTINSGEGNLIQINQILGESVFADTWFLLTRPYSLLNIPDWYLQSPGNTDISGAGGADDTNPETSSVILTSVAGNTIPLIQRGYWFSRSYVETRWTDGERDLIDGNSITEDSNMRWFDSPSPLRGDNYNWGIRWDGYVSVTPGIYGFQVQTNVDIRIDMGIGSSTPYWVNVFNTRGNSARINEDTYVSSATFDTDDIDPLFKYFTGDGEDDWVAYVPITVRLFNGGPDKVDNTLNIPNYPNIFIKTTSLASPETYYSEEYEITLSGSSGDWSVTSPSLAEIISILEDTDAGVSYNLVAEGDNIFPIPVSINLTTENGAVSSTLDDSSIVASTYTLKVSPELSEEFENNKSALWKGNIASPSPSHQTYADMVDGNFTPDQQKIPYDSRPDWWKITEGYPYNRGQSPSKDNNPLDGLTSNLFKSTLSSTAPDVGLYGDGSGVYSNKPNIIIGEARFGSETLGSNYTGIRLVPNRLGEGGKMTISGFPVNNSTFTGLNTLGENDLGGDPNHKTISFANSTSRVVRLYLDGSSDKYYLHEDIDLVSGDDDPDSLGLPSDFNDLAWISPITVIATQVSDDENFTANVKSLVAPLTLSVEKLVVNTYNVVAFSTTLTSLLTGGSEAGSFSGKYIRYYTEDNLAFQYGLVDTGEGLSFSDVLKITYDGVSGNFLGSASEVPRPPSDRVTPFGFDLPQYGGGLCYPPYSINNPLLSAIAISDGDLYDNKPSGSYDVIWGDHTKAGLGGKTLTITEKLEFSGFNSVAELPDPSSVGVNFDNYTHKMKVEMLLNPDLYDEDVLIHIGNEEVVKDSYYVYVNLN